MLPPDLPDVFSLPLQFVLVESIKRFVVMLDDASASVLTGEDTDATARGDDEPLFDDAVPLEPMPDVSPDDDGCNCCHGGILSLFLSNRLASSNENFFLLAMTCLAAKRTRRTATDED